MKSSLKKLLSVLISVVLIFSTFSATIAYAAVTPAVVMGAASHPVNGWSSDKKTYYKDNKAVKGMQKIDGHYYYFNKKTHKMVTGWLTVDGKKYYFSRATATRGQAFKGLQRIEGEYYYFDKKDFNVRTGWLTVDGKKYYFSTAKKHYGQAFRGLKTVNGKKYYFDKKNLNIQTGWKTIDGKKYYFSKQKKTYGQAVTGTRTIDGVKYAFDKNGVCQYKLNAMDIKANSLSSKTNYLILVNKKTHRVGIYKGKKYNWVKIKDWACTVGAYETPTPTGDFTIGPKNGKPFHQLYFDSGAVRCWYATRIIGNYLFHSVLYTQTSRPEHIAYGTLGANLSHGCVRLHIDNAKWIYDNLPANTRTIIYYQ